MWAMILGPDPLTVSLCEYSFSPETKEVAQTIPQSSEARKHNELTRLRSGLLRAPGASTPTPATQTSQAASASFPTLTSSRELAEVRGIADIVVQR